MGTEEIELVRKGYDAFIAGDIEWLNEHMHENIVWHVGGHSRFAGDYRGREDVLAFFAKAVQVAVNEFDVHDIAAGDDHVVAVLDATWRTPNGDSFWSRAVQVFHIANGQAIESWFLVEDQPGLDAFIDAASTS
jgi:ketosteroid isomerase-like protein